MYCIHQFQALHSRLRSDPPTSCETHIVHSTNTIVHSTNTHRHEAWLAASRFEANVANVPEEPCGHRDSDRVPAQPRELQACSVEQMADIGLGPDLG